MFKYVDETTKSINLNYKTARIEYRGFHLNPTDIIRDVIPNDAELIFYPLLYDLQSTKPDSKEEMISDDASEFLNNKRNRENMSISQKPNSKVLNNVVKHLEKNLQNKTDGKDKDKDKEKKKDESKKPNESHNEKNKNSNQPEVNNKHKHKVKSESRSEDEKSQGIT